MMATRSQPDHILKRIVDFERRLHALETSPRIGYASIGDGGQLVVMDNSGNPVLRIGTLSIGGYGIERWNGTAWVAVT